MIVAAVLPMMVKRLKLNSGLGRNTGIAYRIVLFGPVNFIDFNSILYRLHTMLIYIDGVNKRHNSYNNKGDNDESISKARSKTGSLA